MSSRMQVKSINFRQKSVVTRINKLTLEPGWIDYTAFFIIKKGEQDYIYFGILLICTGSNVYIQAQIHAIKSFDKWYGRFYNIF